MNRVAIWGVYWLCAVFLVFLPVMALYLLFNLEFFAVLAAKNLALPIIWASVSQQQWLFMWFLSVLHLSLAWLGVYFLRKAFARFSRGEFFNQSNCKCLRLFAIFLLLQSLMSPFLNAIYSVLLSWNHPPGEKLLVLSYGSPDIKLIALAMIFWVISDLLVRATNIDRENKQFI